MVRKIHPHVGKSTSGGEIQIHRLNIDTNINTRKKIHIRRKDTHAQVEYGHPHQQVEKSKSGENTHRQMEYENPHPEVAKLTYTCVEIHIHMLGNLNPHVKKFTKGGGCHMERSGWDIRIPREGATSACEKI